MAKVMITDTILRDAHQSQAATRMRTEDMLPACEILDKIGYYSLECWGGATFDSCLRFLNEDPWERLRKLRKALPNTKLQMLFRGQNILGYKHYADDVVDEFVRLSIKNGIDIIRIFDALNDVRNLETAIKATKKYGGICEVAMSYTVSPVHTEDYFVKLAQEIEATGADIICIKDMANLLLPYKAYSLVKRLKESVKIPIHLHTHNTSGTGDMTLLKAVEAGVDIVDTALSPLGNGTSQPATEPLVATLNRYTYSTGLDLSLMSQAAVHFRKVADKLKAEGFLDPKVLSVDINTLLYQVPGGMLSNLISQLKQANASDKFYEVLAEVPRGCARTSAIRRWSRHQPDRRHPGRDERFVRRALQAQPQGVPGPDARRVWPPAGPGERGSAPQGHWRRQGHYASPRRTILRLNWRNTARRSASISPRTRMCSPMRCSRRWPPSSSNTVRPSSSSWTTPCWTRKTM